MAFKRKLLSEVPPGPADVEILFHGQLLLRSDTGATCDVAVNPTATNHVLSIEVRTKRPGKPDDLIKTPDLINMRHVGPLHFRQPEGMLIEVLHPPINPSSAWKCVALEAIDHCNGDVPADDRDFRWILNLEGGLFHEGRLNAPIFGSQNVIRLAGGEYFFQTALRADGRLLYKRTGGGKNDKDLRRIGAIAKASVFLFTGQQVVMRWNDGSQEQVLTLTKTPGTTYEIYIQNAPLYQPSSGPEIYHDELVEYYKVIPTTGAKFQLTPIPPATPVGEEPPGEEGSPDIPCQVMVLDGPTD